MHRRIKTPTPEHKPPTPPTVDDLDLDLDIDETADALGLRIYAPADCPPRPARLKQRPR